jgi:catechol 2,3-dioxygenase-like lactoylglutathione lyase family enzyme
MEISVGLLDHYNVSTRKLKETVQFYEDVLGFVNGPRPQFHFPGAWLYSAGHPVLHLNDISQTDKPQPPDSGVIDHVAFSSRGFGRWYVPEDGSGSPQSTGPITGEKQARSSTRVSRHVARHSEQQVYRPLYSDSSSLRRVRLARRKDASNSLQPR